MLFVPGPNGVASVTYDSSNDKIKLSTVTLEDKIVYSISADTTVENVIYSRTLKNPDALYSWCVPFDFTYTEEVSEHISFYRIDTFEVFDDTRVEIHTKSIPIGDVLYANMPYFIQSDESGQTYTFNALTLGKKNIILKPSMTAVSTGTPVCTYTNEQGYFHFYPVHKKTTVEDFGGYFYTITASGAISRQTKPTSSVDSFRWLFQYIPYDNG